MAVWRCGASTGKAFLVEVPNQTRQTLEEAIQAHILPATHIISDGWASYGRIKDIQGRIYTYDVIIHDSFFVDPDDPEIHTQAIEGT